MAFFEFTYPITRPYPYNWFKWAVLIGGIILTVLLSVLNLASTGYDLIVQHSTNPNQTTSAKLWTDKLPLSLNSKTVATCEPQNVPATAQYFTNKFGLTYTLDNVWQTDSTGKNTTLPSLQYLNNPLEDCYVTLVTLDMNKWNGRTASEVGWTPWGLKANGFMTCHIYNGARTSVNLTTQYELISTTIETGVPFQFVQTPDEHKQTSMYWGQSLMSWYWLAVTHAMQNASLPDINYEYVMGSISLQPSANVTDITSLDFFSPPNYHFVDQEYDLRTNTIEQYDCCINPTFLPGASIGYLNAISSMELQDDLILPRIPDVWIQVDSFAKVFISTMLADMGQNSSVTALNDPMALHHFSKNITKMRGDGYNPFTLNNTAPLDGPVEAGVLHGGPARAPYNEAKGGDLTITPSMLYSQYTCQVPRLKSTGSLIFGILVADLVFLQAAWVILTWVTVHVMQSRIATAHHCSGCMGEVIDNAAPMSPPFGKKVRAYQAVPNRTGD